MNKRRIELLAPARDYDAGCAAVDYGADALYVGGPRFGARVAAGNAVEDIARLVRYARPFGVRVYAALNTLLFDRETHEARRTAQELADAGIDALIVQDMAYRRMGIEGVEFHASTQAQVRTPGQAAFLGQCGFSRLILERGLTLKQIKEIRTATDAALEVFVHGAICVGYSGRCYLSRTMGPRSGNRGDCAQPCRLAWDMEDAAGRKILASKHLLSLRDLDLSAQIPSLLAAGVDSFKIEGRLKDTAYIKNTVAWYRRAIDEVIDPATMERASAGHSIPDFEPDPSRTFTRGATAYYLGGKVRGAAGFDTPKAVGNPVGRVQGCDRTGFTLPAEHGLEAGDGICFLTPGGGLGGTNVNRVEGTRILPNRMEGITPSTEIFRNYDHRFTLALARSRTRRVMDITARVEFLPYRIALTLTCADGIASHAEITGDFEPARDPARMEDTVRAQVAKSGEWPFAVTRTDIAGEPVFVPVATLNALRREAMERLLAARAAVVPPRDLRPEDPAARYPGQTDPYLNITNALAAAFYRDHGVANPAPGIDLRGEYRDMEAMRTPYCLRRETGECLLEGSRLRGPLYLVQGGKRYLLGFDCENCEMTLTYE